MCPSLPPSLRLKSAASSRPGKARAVTGVGSGIRRPAAAVHSRWPGLARKLCYGVARAIYYLFLRRYARPVAAVSILNNLGTS